MKDVVRVQFVHIDGFVLDFVLRYGIGVFDDQIALKVTKKIDRQRSTFLGYHGQSSGHLFHLKPVSAS